MEHVHTHTHTHTQRQQLVVAQEMFKESPTLTREQKALILGFMAGARGELGHCYIPQGLLFGDYLNCIFSSICMCLYVSKVVLKVTAKFSYTYTLHILIRTPPLLFAYIPAPAIRTLSSVSRFPDKRRKHYVCGDPSPIS